MPTPPEQMQRRASPLPLYVIALWAVVATLGLARWWWLSR